MLGLSVIILFKSLLHVFCSLVFSAHNSSAILAAIVYNLYRLHLLLLLLLVNNLMLRNLFSSDGTTVLYGKAVADCLANEKLTKILGKPVKTFGESIIKMSSL